MSDQFASYAKTLESPAFDAVAITPADSDLANEVRALYIGGAGNVAVKTQGGTTVVFVGLLAGAILPVRCRQVRSTSTTATNIVGLL